MILEDSGPLGFGFIRVFKVKVLRSSRIERLNGKLRVKVNDSIKAVVLMTYLAWIMKTIDS